MPLTGYQDWQRVNFAAGLIVASWNAAVSATQNIRAINVSAWTYLNVQMFNPGGGPLLNVQLVWFADSAFSVQVYNQNIILSSNMNTAFCVPVVTPWVQINLVPKATGNNTTIVLNVYGSNQYSTCFEFGTFSNPLTAGAHALGINGVSNDFTSFNYFGNALLHVWTSSANPCAVDVGYLDFATNAYITYLHYDAVALGAPLRELITVPASQLRITLTNGGVAQTVTQSLTAAQ
jgi:hypothetical protein